MRRSALAPVVSSDCPRTSAMTPTICDHARIVEARESAHGIGAGEVESRERRVDERRARRDALVARIEVAPRDESRAERRGVACAHLVRRRHRVLRRPWHVPRDVNVGVPFRADEDSVRRVRYGCHARNSRDAVAERMHCVRESCVGVARSRDVEIRYDQVVAIEAERGRFRPPQAPRENRRAHEQHERQRHLRADQQRAESRAVRHRASGGTQRRREIDARRAKRRHQAEEQDRSLSTVRT